MTTKTYSKITYKNHEFDFEAAVNLMDEEITNTLHDLLALCNDQLFFDEYVKAHSTKYNCEFVIN